MEEMKMNVVVKDTTAYIFNRKIVIARENLVKAQENLAHTFPALRECIGGSSTKFGSRSAVFLK